MEKIVTLKYRKKDMQACVLILTVVSVFFIMSGLWAIDIGVSGMVAEANGLVNQGLATNGWWTRSSCQQYHVGLLFVFVGMLTQSILLVYTSLNLRKSEDNK